MVGVVRSHSLKRSGRKSRKSSAMEVENNHLGHLFFQKVGSSKAQLVHISAS